VANGTSQAKLVFPAPAKDLAVAGLVATVYDGE
jgi:hypothetical protein